MTMTEQEKKIITDYLVTTAKKELDKANTRTVDFFVSFFFAELQNIGAHDKAQEVVNYYNEKWG